MDDLLESMSALSLQPDKGRYPHSQHNLPRGKSILQHMKKGTKFEISQVLSLNRCFITPCKKNALMELQDNIIDYVEKVACLDKVPPKFSIVAAPYTDNNYYRVVITDIISSEKVVVQSVDLGYQYETPLKLIKPVSEELMKVPPMGYEIELHGIKNIPDLILWKDFIEFMRTIKRNTYKIKSCTENNIVSLAVVDGKLVKGSLLHQIIQEKLAWKWEQVYRQGYKEDRDIFSKVGWEIPVMVHSWESEIYQLPIGAEFEGVVANDYYSDGCLDLINVNFTSILDDEIILQNQITRYMKTVTHTKFFPVIGEAVLLFIKNPLDGRPEMPVRGLNRWNRCYRDGMHLVNLDLQESYPLNVVQYEGNKECFMYRLMCPEFFRVPFQIIQCIIKGLTGKEVTKSMHKKGQKFLKRSKRIKFKVEGFDSESRLHTIECPALSTLIAKGASSGPST